jgi:hypothetical protein
MWFSFITLTVHVLALCGMLRDACPQQLLQDVSRRDGGGTTAALGACSCVKILLCTLD